MKYRKVLDKGGSILCSEGGSDMILRKVSNNLHGEIALRLKSYFLIVFKLHFMSFCLLFV